MKYEDEAKTMVESAEVSKVLLPDGVWYNTSGTFRIYSPVEANPRQPHRDRAGGWFEFTYHDHHNRAILVQAPLAAMVAVLSYPTNTEAPGTSETDESG